MSRISANQKNGRVGSPSGPEFQARHAPFLFNSFLTRPSILISAFKVAAFAPAHLAHRAACGRLPGQRPLARVQISFCSPRKCPTGGFRMPAEMITQILQKLTVAIRQILPHARPQRGFAHQTEFPF